MRKLFIIISIVILFYGCGASTKKILSSQQDALILAEEVVELKKKAAARGELEGFVGFMNLKDKRSPQDITYMTSIRERVSEEILQQLRVSGLFKEIHYPLLDDDRIVIGGSVHKFILESAETMISYIPVVNVFTIFGLPSQRVRAEVDISIEFRNKDTGEVIKNFREKYHTQRKYNIYSFKQDKEKRELSSCFVKVIKRLVERIRKNKNDILDSVEIIPVISDLEREQKVPLEEDSVEEDIAEDTNAGE